MGWDDFGIFGGPGGCGGPPPVVSGWRMACSASTRHSAKEGCLRRGRGGNAYRAPNVDPITTTTPQTRSLRIVYTQYTHNLYWNMDQPANCATGFHGTAGLDASAKRLRCMRRTEQDWVPPPGRKDRCSRNPHAAAIRHARGHPPGCAHTPWAYSANPYVRVPFSLDTLCGV